MLEKLRAILAQSHNAAVVGRALHGLGGVGKTRLAVEYAWRYRADYAALLFVPAQDGNTLDKGLADIATVLDLPEKAAPQQDVRVAAALRWLNSHRDWLLICDNVDDVAARDALLPRIANLAGGHVLITGRLADQSPAYPSLTLDVLAVDDAAEFLLERAARRAQSPNDAALAGELAAELGGLALGLEQAAAYIERRQIGFAAYLKLWRENREKVLGWFDKTATAYNHDVGLAATWMTSVAQLTPDGRRLLARLGWLAPDPIPDSLFDVSATGDEAFDAREALADLLAYSLVSAGAENGTRMVTVHRLVQDFARRELAADWPGALKEALEWLSWGFAYDPDDVRSWPVLEPLMAHAMAVASAADRASISKSTADLLNRLGIVLKSKARFAEAEPLYRRALEIFEKSAGPNHPDVASTLNNLALLLCATNRLAEAEPMLRRALTIDEARFGPHHSEVATNLNNLAELLRASNRFEEAESLYRRSLGISRMRLGHKDSKVAICLNNLALLLHTMGRYEESEPMYRQALEIDEDNCGPNHPNTAIRLNNLASLMSATDRHAEAETMFRRAVVIVSKSLGEHPMSKRFCDNYRCCLLSLGKSEAAAQSAVDALIDEHARKP